MSKIGDLSVRDADLDLWVLCATSEIKSQIADKVSTFGKRSSISTLILDWSASGLPPLAVALAAASGKTRDFLRERNGPEGSVVRVEAALQAVENDPAFELQAARIRERPA